MLQYQKVVWVTVVCPCLIEAHSFSQKEGESMNMRAHAISLYCVKQRELRPSSARENSIGYNLTKLCFYSTKFSNSFSV